MIADVIFLLAYGLLALGLGLWIRGGEDGEPSWRATREWKRRQKALRRSMPKDKHERDKASERRNQ